MNPGLVVKLRPSGPWRIGPDSGARNRVDVIYHSDSLYSAVTSAMSRLGWLEDWLDATARSGSPAVSFSSCFPYLDDVVFVVPPRTVWPPASQSTKAARVRWKSARFVPLTVVQSILAGRRLDENQWSVDGASDCLVPAGKPGPFRTAVRSSAGVDRLTGASERHSTACIEFRAGSGLWTVVSFVDQAAHELWSGKVKAAFRLLADTGFGGERSRGWGRSEAPEFIDGMLPDLILPLPSEKEVAEAAVIAPSPVAPLILPSREASLPNNETNLLNRETTVSHNETTSSQNETVVPSRDREGALPNSTEPEAPAVEMALAPEPGAAAVEAAPVAETGAPAAEAAPTTEPDAPAVEAAAATEPEAPAESAPATEPEAPVVEAAAATEPDAPVVEAAAATGPEAPVVEAAPAPEPDASAAGTAPAAESEVPIVEAAAEPEPEARAVEAVPATEPEVPAVDGAHATDPEAPAVEAGPDTESEAPIDTAPAAEHEAEAASNAEHETTPVDAVPDAQAEVPVEADPTSEPEAPAVEAVPAAEPAPSVLEATTPAESEPKPQAAVVPAAPTHPHWLLSLFTPAPADSVDWRRGNYTVLPRGGRVDSPAGSGELKKQIQMVAEGSVLYAETAPRGSAADVAPDGFAHPVFRAGFAVAIPLPEVR